MSSIFIRGQNYQIESVSDILINIGASAVEAGLKTSLQISNFAYFLKSCCPSVPDKYCRLLGFSPSGEPVFTLTLDVDEVVSLQGSIVLEFLGGRIERLEALKGENSETDKKISEKIKIIKKAVEEVSVGLKQITVTALIDTLEIGDPNTSSNILPANTTIDNTIPLREQIRRLEEQVKAAESKAKV